MNPSHTKGEPVKYKVHRFDLRMTQDQNNLERFLNELRGEVVAVVPNVTPRIFWFHHVNFVLVVEKVAG